jgi:hypothetical protein
MSALNTVFADDKLGLLAELNYMTSVFECLDLTQYKMILNVITRHPKYNKVNADSNNNLSSALALYLRFLEYKNDSSLSHAESNIATGYYDLMVELSKGAAHGINDYQAYVTQNGVTNSKEDLLRQFAYMQNLNEEENTRKMQEYDVLKKAIEMYDSTTTKVVFIPALDDDQSFYMNRTKVGLDYLSEKADAAKLQADSAAYSAKRYLYLQTCFGEEYVIDENGNRKQIKNTSGQRAHADELYENLKKEIQQLTTDAACLTADGKLTNQEELNVSDPFCGASIVGVGMSFAKRFVLLILSAYVLVYTVMAISEKRKKDVGGEADDRD